MKEFILENIEYILTLVILPTVTWFFSKRHFQARELNNKDIEIIRQNLKLYQELINDIESRYEAKLSKLYDEIQNLEIEITRLKELIIISDGEK